MGQIQKINMAVKTSIDKAVKVINDNIYKNGSGQITGEKLNNVLITMMGSVSSAVTESQKEVILDTKDIQEGIDKANSFATQALKVANDAKSTSSDALGYAKSALSEADKAIEVSNDASDIVCKFDNRISKVEKKACENADAIENFKAGTTEIKDHAVTEPKLSTDVAGKLLTSEMKDYLASSILEKKKEEASKLFTVSTVPEKPLDYDASLVDAAKVSVNIIVTLRYRNKVVQATTYPKPYLKNDTDDYVYALSLANQSVAAGEFTYKIPDGDEYAGITVSGYSAPETLNIVYPAWYGFSPVNNIDRDDLTENVTKYEKITEDMPFTPITVKNLAGKDGYFCIITRGSADFVQFGSTLLDKPYTGVAFASPNSPDGDTIVIGGYKVYYTEKTAEPNGEFARAAMKIKLS